ncbi:FecCD family ABC transporter permease [Polycladidibacter hongkongensis]|uniref:FecCD family ABC transporter permease n=1 Tax=Polycladidibacter hongkongensis TaxID=1647556 RepID=UPI0008333B8F|nr:iron ABC transporter permease [Pseudovibrio hongkongensis]
MSEGASVLAAHKAATTFSLVQIICAGFAALVLSVYLAVSVGAVTISMEAVWGILVNKLLPGMVEPSWSLGREKILWEIRLPRALLAIMVGAGLSIVGACLQSATRNPLADPHLIGISAGGALGAVLALLHTGLFLGLLTVPLLAFAGALGATLLVISLAKFTSAMSADRLVLTGVAVSFVLMAGVNILIFLADPRATHSVVYWMLGGLGLAQWSHLIYPLAVLLPCSLWLWSRAGYFNAMTIGDETATTLGIPVGKFRLEAFVIGALITGVMVAFSGMIGFVGLMVPHIVRLFVGGDYHRLIPVSALFGAIFLLLADVCSRTVMKPEDMPIGIVTGLVGGVFFIWLLREKA